MTITGLLPNSIVPATEHHGVFIVPTPPTGIFNSEDNIGITNS